MFILYLASMIKLTFMPSSICFWTICFSLEPQLEVQFPSKIWSFSLIVFPNRIPWFNSPLFFTVLHRRVMGYCPSTRDLGIKWCRFPLNDNHILDILVHSPIRWEFYVWIWWCWFCLVAELFLLSRPYGNPKHSDTSLTKSREMPLATQ